MLADLQENLTRAYVWICWLAVNLLSWNYENMLHEVKTLKPHTKSDFDIDREKTFFLSLSLSYSSWSIAVVSWRNHRRKK